MAGNFFYYKTCLPTCTLLLICLISWFLSSSPQHMCQGQNLQIIYMNTTYNHSIVNEQNVFGNGNGGMASANIIASPNNNERNNDIPGPREESKKNTELSEFSPYFGVELVPYTKSASVPVGDYTTEDVRQMLKVILTKCSSVLTLEMGFQDQLYDGPWDITTPSEISRVAAQINSEHNTRLLTISQGAGILNKQGPQPDIEAAFSTAEPANSLFPNTVWGITLIPNYHDSSTEGFVQIRPDSRSIVLFQLQKYLTRAHTMNLKLGVFVDQCDAVMGGGSLKKLLVDMAQTSDYFVCSVYPKTPVAEPTDYFNVVVNLYQTIRQSFGRVAPSLEVILQTGWATRGESRNNPDYMNSPKKAKKFWELVAKWSKEKQVRVFMHEAFDVPKRTGNSSWGYWRALDNEDHFEEKANGEIIHV